MKIIYHAPTEDHILDHNDAVKSKESDEYSKLAEDGDINQSVLEKLKDASRLIHVTRSRYLDSILNDGLIGYHHPIDPEDRKWFLELCLKKIFPRIHPADQDMIRRFIIQPENLVCLDWKGAGSDYAYAIPEKAAFFISALKELPKHKDRCRFDDSDIVHASELSEKYRWLYEEKKNSIVILGVSKLLPEYRKQMLSVLEGYEKYGLIDGEEDITKLADRFDQYHCFKTDHIPAEWLNIISFGTPQEILLTQLSTRDRVFSCLMER